MSHQGDSNQQGHSGRNEIHIHLFGRTDVGQIREHNEDNFLVADLTRRSRSLMEPDRHQIVGEQGTILGVCDGMGGAAAGEVASQLAVDIIYEKLSEGEAPTNRDELARRLVRAIEEAGQRIFNEACADRSRRGMGTTSTVAALVDSRLYLGQVGDSRAYILRGEKLVQVTRDQSLVNQLIEAGQLTEEEAETFEHNNIILQALGTAESVQVDLTYVDLEQGDTLMLCSDGLSGMLRAEDLRQVLVEQKDPLEACRILTDRANQAGGHDNITVIVAQFTGDGLPPAQGAQVAYQKYQLSQPTADATVRAAPLSVPEAEAIEPSEEASREARKLRVAHTMIGDTSLVPPNLSAQTSDAAPSDPSNSFPPESLPGSNIYPYANSGGGLSPTLVGMLVLGALAIAAIAGGFFALAN